MNVADELKKYRSLKGLTQEAAAKLIGESLRSWQEWEQGRRVPSGRALERLWDILKAPGAKSKAKSFAERLRLYRAQTNQNRDAAAKTLGVSAGWIADCEQERRVPRAEVILRVLPMIEKEETCLAEQVKKNSTPEAIAQRQFEEAKFEMLAADIRRRRRFYRRCAG